MRRSYSRDDVETHYGSDRPAVNVKVYTSMDAAWRDWRRDNPDADPRFCEDWAEENESDTSLDSLFWLVCGWEWETLELDAAEIFGPHVTLEQDGRSGGWCVVRGLPDLDEWDAVQLAKWRKFERYAKAVAAGVPYQLIECLYLNKFPAWADEESERIGAEAFAPEGVSA